MDPWRLPIGEHRDIRNRVLEISRLKDTIIAIDSESYGPDGEPNDSVDQDTKIRTTSTPSVDAFWFPSVDRLIDYH